MHHHVFRRRSDGQIDGTLRGRGFGFYPMHAFIAVGLGRRGYHVHPCFFTRDSASGFTLDNPATKERPAPCLLLFMQDVDASYHTDFFSNMVYLAS